MIEAMKQALEALEWFDTNAKTIHEIQAARPSVITLRQAIAEAEKQEPVAWMYQCNADSSPCFMQHKTNWAESGSGLWTETPLYTHQQPKRDWVGLTEQERNDIEDMSEMMIGKPAFDAIEKRLKQKNGYEDKNT